MESLSLKSHWKIRNRFISSGTDAIILKIFSPKNLAQILAFWALTSASVFKHLIKTLVFEKKRHFFRRNLTKNRRKL
jgi:hypothetical protein